LNILLLLVAVVELINIVAVVELVDLEQAPII
jgi:hypothetical protein